MKTLLLALSAVALTAITFNATASDALLSPRAAGNQITAVSSTANNVNLAAVDRGIVISPRAATGKLTTVAGTTKEINPATKCSMNMTASPKAVQACAANSAAAMPCCAKSVAAN
jgi:ATP-dependent exoDNAse (exonuclease V) alpha subunit